MILFIYEKSSDNEASSSAAQGKNPRFALEDFPESVIFPGSGISAAAGILFSRQVLKNPSSSDR